MLKRAAALVAVAAAIGAWTSVAAQQRPAAATALQRPAAAAESLRPAPARRADEGKGPFRTLVH